jgi:hypothetical protein
MTNRKRQEPGPALGAVSGAILSDRIGILGYGCHRSKLFRNVVQPLFDQSDWEPLSIVAYGWGLTVLIDVGGKRRYFGADVVGQAEIAHDPIYRGLS